MHVVVAMVLIVLCVASGCSAVEQTYGIDADDLSWVVPGIRRELVEERLGTPESTEALVSLTIATYSFNRGYKPPAHDSPAWWPVAAVGWGLQDLLTLGAIYGITRHCQRADLDFKYDSTGKVVDVLERLQSTPLYQARHGAARWICERTRANLLPSTLNFPPPEQPPSRLPPAVY